MKVAKAMPGIPISETTPLSMSYLDRQGRLFEWKGQPYRGITRKGAPLCRRILGGGIVDRLVAKGLLVETSVTSFCLDGYELVLKHRRVPFVSYVYEWSPRMLKDAALLVLDINLELARSGLATKDGHPWNVLFDASRPVYVDFGSIVELPDSMPWPAHEEFCKLLLRPLVLYSMGENRVARWLLHDYVRGVEVDDIEAFACRPNGFSGLWHAAKVAFVRGIRRTSGKVRKRLPERVKRPIRHIRDVVRKRTFKSRTVQLRHLRRTVAALDPPSHKTAWSGYYEDHWPPHDPTGEWTPKHVNFERVLTESRPATLLDIGSNRGWYSLLAAKKGSRVVALDTDDMCIDMLYDDAKKASLSVLPLVVDFTNPSPGYGLSNRWMLPALERFPCDLVLALALSHHLVFKRGLDFDQIAKALSQFSKRWLIVEFVPREDKWVSGWYSEEFSWYNLGNFTRALRKYFASVDVLDSYPKPRTLLVCEKSQ